MVLIDYVLINSNTQNIPKYLINIDSNHGEFVSKINKSIKILN